MALMGMTIEPTTRSATARLMMNKLETYFVLRQCECQSFIVERQFLESYIFQLLCLLSSSFYGFRFVEI
jgi:hypothetical protein